MCYAVEAAETTRSQFEKKENLNNLNNLSYFYQPYLYPKLEAIQNKEIVNCAAYAEGKRVADLSLREVHSVLIEENRFVWIGLHEPSEEVLSLVQQEFNLHK